MRSGSPKTCESGGSGSGSATLILTSRSGKEDTASWATLSRRLWERLSEVGRLKNMWIRWIRIRNTDSHLKERGGRHRQLGEAGQEVAGEAKRGHAAQKHVDPVDPDPQTLILTSRSREADTASWARLSRRLWERLSEVMRPKNMWIRWIRIRKLILTWRSGEEDTASWARLSRRSWERLSEVRWPKNMWIRIRIRKH